MHAARARVIAVYRLAVGLTVRDVAEFCMRIRGRSRN
jgi:hypothetical protein